jgi:hypothetical protein
MDFPTAISSDSSEIKNIWVKSDEMILGNSYFVHMDSRNTDDQIGINCHLILGGYRFKNIAERVAKVMDMSLEINWKKSLQHPVFKALSLLCY